MTDITDMNKFRKIILTKENGEQTKPGADTIDYLLKMHFSKALGIECNPYYNSAKDTTSQLGR